MNNTIKRAFIDSIGTVAYIVLIVLIISSLENFLPQGQEPIIIPIVMLLLFVVSAAITGFLVFGKPIMLYIDGQKREAVSLLGYTLGILFLTTFLFFILLVIYFNFI